MSTSSTYSYEVYSTLFFISLGHNHKWYTKTLSQINQKTPNVKQKSAFIFLQNMIYLNMMCKQHPFVEFVLLRKVEQVD